MGNIFDLYFARGGTISSPMKQTFTVLYKIRLTEFIYLGISNVDSMFMSQLGKSNKDDDIALYNLWKGFCKLNDERHQEIFKRSISKRLSIRGC